MRVLIEAVGSPVWGPSLKWLKEAAEWIVGTDIDPMSWGFYRINAGHLVPPYGDPEVWEKLTDICLRHSIDTVIPSIHEGLPSWAERRDELARRGINVIVSDLPAIKICDDKWATYEFFLQNGIPAPATSLEAKYPLLKSRRGRGGAGMRRLDLENVSGVDMNGNITQEILEGREYSVDALCNRDGEPACIVVRERLGVESGVSVKGRVVNEPEIEKWVRAILGRLRFFGPVDVQCFKTGRGIFFTEINPRIAGGLSLSMAATGNWFQWLQRMIDGEKIGPQPVNHKLVMLRCYEDVIVDEAQILHEK